MNASICETTQNEELPGMINRLARERTRTSGQIISGGAKESLPIKLADWALETLPQLDGRSYNPASSEPIKPISNP